MQAPMEFAAEDFYQAVPPKRPVALVGSSGFLEIAVNGGSAERVLGLRIGTRVVLRALIVSGMSREGERPREP